jgi:radical SAM protein with 4Fe4S-binding SPASM domain
MVLRHWIDGGLQRVPLLGDLYWRNSARLKKTWCIGLHRSGLLRPSAFVSWVATRQCNFACPFCEASAGPAASGELTTAEAKALVDELVRMRVRRLLVTGGEPAMRADLPQILTYACKRGITPGLLSNGSLIDKRWSELSNLYYFLFMSSIDGLPEYHDRLRRPGSFASVLRAVELFASIGTPSRVIKTVVHADNAGDLPAMLEILRSSGATEWSLTPALPVGRAAADTTFASGRRELRAILDFVRANRHRAAPRVQLAESHSYLGCIDGCGSDRPFFCGAGLTRCTVHQNGDVLACGQVYEKATPAGNIRQTPLGEIWAHGFGTFRRFSKPAHCEGCAQWAACQGGCWAERELSGGCLKNVLGGS